MPCSSAAGFQPMRKGVVTFEGGQTRLSSISRRTALGFLGTATACGMLPSVCRANEAVLRIGSLAQLEASDIPATIGRVVVAARDNALFIPAEPGRSDPAVRGITWTHSNGGKRYWQLAPQPVMTPEMFGLIADGNGDATHAIDAAVEFLVGHGGGTLRFHPGKVYRLASDLSETKISNPAHAASIGLPAGASNLIFDLNGATLLQACDAYTFGAKYRLFNDAVMKRQIVRLAGRLPRRGDSSVLLSTNPGFRVGDVVVLVSRNVTPQAYAPVAEMLTIGSIAGKVVNFVEPVSKDHETDGRELAGLIRITEHHVRNCAIIGPGTIVNQQRRAGNILQVIGFEMRNIRCEGRGGFNIRGRHVVVEDCVSLIQADWSAPVYRPYALAFDTGTTDVTVRNFVADGGDNVTYLHLHEGLADVDIANVTVRNGTRYDNAGEPVAAISIRGTSWNVTIDGVTITNNPQGPGIEARKSVVVRGGNRDLIIRNVRMEGSFRQRAFVLVDDEPAQVSALDLSAVRRGRGIETFVIEGTGHRISRIIQ